MLCLVAQLCPTLCYPMDCSPPDSSVHGDSPGKNTGVGCHALLQGIFPTQGLNPSLLHCRRILYHLSHQGSWKYKLMQSLGNAFYPKACTPKNNLHKLIYENISIYKMPKAALFQSKVATTQILINTRIDKYIFVYSCNQFSSVAQ